MKRNKIVAMLTVLAMSVSVFGGCGTESGTKDTTDTSKTSDESTTETEKEDEQKEDSGEVITLTYGYPETDPLAEAHAKLVEEKFNSEQTKWQVELKPTAGNFNDVLKTQMASNTEPDVFAFDNNMIPSFAESGRILALDSYLEDGYRDDFEEIILEAGTYQDELYTLPIDFNTLVVYYNKDMFAAAGIEKIPETWDELYDAAKKLTTGDTVGLSMDLDIARVQPFFYSNGGTMMKDGKPNVNSPENAEALEYVVNLYEEGICSTPADLGVGGNGDAFAQGYSAMIVDGGWTFGYLEEQNLDFEYDIMPIPISKEEASMIFVGTVAVSANAKDLEGAVELAKTIVSVDGIREKMVKANGGVIPARKSMTEEYLAIAPNRKTIIDVAPSASLYFYGINTPDIIKIFNDNYDRIVRDPSLDAQQVLDDMQAEIDALEE